MIKSVIAVGLLIAGLVSGVTPASAAQQRRTYTGTIDGAEYRVEVPEHWNGDLVMYSHGYFPEGYDPGQIGLANRGETEGWLLDHGYALAASDYKGRSGAVYEQGPRDQLALLDWFGKNVGRPRHTVATGASMGAALSVMLAERNPKKFDGVLAMCAPMDLNGTWNTLLDAHFVLKTLLAPEAELVHVTNPQRTMELLQGAIAEAMRTPQGRARLALVGAVGNVPGWVTADKPRSTDVDEQIRQMAYQISLVTVGTFGPYGRVDLEKRAGGNPSWNVGIDYGRQLANSSERDLARAAYQAAGLDLRADLAALAAAPRISPDRAGIEWMYRFGVPAGTTPTPVMTIHNVADAAEPGNNRWYAQQVRRFGEPERLRQLYVNRPGHCTFTAGEEIVVLKALFERINSGRWPNLGIDRLNQAAGGLGFDKVVDVATFQQVTVRPGFTRFTPSPVQRPSR